MEELLRWVSPLNNMFRTAVRDAEVNDQPLREGERVALLYPAANRDARAFERPQEFDVTRDPTMHMAFGFGTHFCLGANLARVEMKLLLEELVPRITNLRPVSEPDVEPNVFARAVRRFYLGFDRR
ncbi:MAG: cytochrome P450 [Acidimicrobiales bacterium]